MDDFSLADWTGQRWFIDVHLIDAVAASDLRKLGELGWVRLLVADTAYVETMATADDEKRERLRRQLSPYPVAHGPWALDHSHLDMCVLGSDGDGERIDHVYATLWPNNNQADDAGGKTAKGRTRYRDALHIATAVRERATGFVTEDRPVLGRAAQLYAAFDGFRVVNIATVTEELLVVARELRRRSLTTGEPDPTLLPAWPE